jgi:hypothetical protein
LLAKLKELINVLNAPSVKLADDNPIKGTGFTQGQKTLEGFTLFALVASSTFVDQPKTVWDMDFLFIEESLCLNSLVFNFLGWLGDTTVERHSFFRRGHHGSHWIDLSFVSGHIHNSITLPARHLRETAGSGH